MGRKDDKPAKATRCCSCFSVSAFVALIGCCLLGGVLGVVFWPKTDRPGDKGPVVLKPGISKENWAKINPALTRSEIEAILGGSGSKINGDDASVLVTKGQNNVKPIPGGLLKRADVSFSVWRDGGNHVLVGFFASKKYGDLSTYAHLYIDKSDNRTKYEHPESAEGARERQEKA